MAKRCKQSPWTHTIGICVPISTAALFKARADKEGLTPSGLGAKILTEYLEAYGTNIPPIKP